MLDEIKHWYYRIKLKIEVWWTRLNTPDDLLEAHKKFERKSYENSDTCGCFHCLKTYKPSDIEEWVGLGDSTPICPHCGIDSVLPDSIDKKYVDWNFLERMNQNWFDYDR